MRDLALGGRVSAKVHRRAPAFLAARGTLLLAALVGVTMPRGFRGVEHGAGIVGGAAFALMAELLALPLVAVMVGIDDAAVDDELGLAETYASAGVRAGRRRVVKLLGSGWNLAATLALGAAVGAVAGLGDALQAGSGLGGTVPSLVLAPALLGASLYLGFVAFGLAAFLRSRARALLAALFTLVFFTVGMRNIPPHSRLRWLLRAHPVGPLWSAFLQADKKASYVLQMTRQAQLVTMLGWTVAAAIAVASTARRTRTGRS